MPGGPLTLAAESATEAPPRPGRGNQRERILDTALELMSVHGADGTSMRALASACGATMVTSPSGFNASART